MRWLADHVRSDSFEPLLSFSKCAGHFSVVSFRFAEANEDFVAVSYEAQIVRGLEIVAQSPND